MRGLGQCSRRDACRADARGNRLARGRRPMVNLALSWQEAGTSAACLAAAAAAARRSGRPVLVTDSLRITADRKVVEVRLTDKPGTLARAASRLGKARVNIESAYMLSQGKKSTTLALGVKDARAANKALGRR